MFGALETVLAALTLREQVVPPTLNLENPDVELDIVHGGARPQRIEHALTNSFGFGGHNVGLVLGRARTGRRGDAPPPPTQVLRQ